MNILTFDIEEWYLEKACFGDRKEKYQIFDYYLSQILEQLDERHTIATFFCVGGMAREFPEVVRKIANHGHEIGCHSNQHVWLNKLTEKQLFADTRDAIDSIEQCIGQKVLSYRAPAFSIGEHNKWALGILAQCGIERDASIFPAARDFGGFCAFGSQEPCIVKYEGLEIKEFPITTARLIGKDVAYSGGGYFRFFPLSFIVREMKKSDYAMTYFHIGDLIPESESMMTKEAYEEYFKQKGTLLNRYKRHIKSNLGKKGAFCKMKKLINRFEYVSIDEASSQIDWKSAPVVVL